MAENALKSGAALKKLKELISAQDGNAEIIENYKLFKQAKFCVDITTKDLNVESGSVDTVYGNGRDKKKGLICCTT